MKRDNHGNGQVPFTATKSLLFTFLTYVYHLAFGRTRSKFPKPLIMISSEALDEVSHLRVSAENPVTSTDEYLDFERCAALHNAILKHGWMAGGRDWADAPSHPQWTDETVPEGATENLHPDLIEFLKHCLALEEHGIFFHFTVGLNPCSDLWERLDMDGDCIALYNQNDSSSLSATTIM